MLRPLLFLAVVAIGLDGLTPVLAQDGKLDEARQEIHDPPKKKDNTKDSDKDDDGGFFGGILSDLLSGFFEATIGEFKGDQERGYFQRYPFADGSDGFMWLQQDPHAPVDPHVGGWFGRLSLEESNDFHTINRVNGEWLVDTTFRIGLSGDWSYLTERRPCGCIDDLFLGRVNAVVRILQDEKIQLRTGIGVCFETDRGGSDAGFNFTLGGDWFPAKPWVVSTGCDLGWLGDAFVSHVRATGGAMLGRWEFYGGYDFLRIGSVNFQGPVAGIRFWF